MAFVLACRVSSNAGVLNNTKYVGSLCAHFLLLVFILLESRSLSFSSLLCYMWMVLTMAIHRWTLVLRLILVRSGHSVLNPCGGSTWRSEGRRRYRVFWLRLVHASILASPRGYSCGNVLVVRLSATLISKTSQRMKELELTPRRIFF